MREKYDVLEQALAAIAAEETRTLEQQMTFSDMQAAKRLQLNHSKENLSLIRKHTRSFRTASFLRAAAAIAVVAGGLMLLHSSMPEKTDITTPAAPPISIHTGSPSATSTPNSSPFEHFAPTSTPVIIEYNGISPTLSPHHAFTSSPVPTAVPTPAASPIPTDAPTATPSPVPTASPLPTVTPAPAPQVQHPEGWQGKYFPAANAAGWTLKKSAGNIAVYDDNYEFTEYNSITHTLANGSEIADYQYVMINGAPALLTEDQAGQFTLTWDMGGQTLSLFSPDGEKQTLLDIANSVVKLPEN